MARNLRQKMMISAVRLNSLKLFISWAIVAFGQSAWSGTAGVLASLFGYALFWFCAAERADRFKVAVVWFSAVQAVQISWMASTVYMGPLIYIVYIALCIAMGVQFGCLSALIRRPLTLPLCLGIAGFWVVMEWMRLYLLTGFPWNPVGMALAAHPASIQFASLFGIYGLSFWVIWVNLLALRAWDTKRWVVWAVCGALPFVFGYCNQSYWEKNLKGEKTWAIGLVQTAYRPEQKDYNHQKADAYIPASEQWARILRHLKNTKRDRFDLIVMPEGAVPLGAKKGSYPLEMMQQIWIQTFGAKALDALPPLEAPHAYKSHYGSWRVSNAFLAQAVANYYQSEVIVGLVDYEPGTSYNAAFHFKPNDRSLNRYEKRVLVPAGEYIPFGGSRFVADVLMDLFGIADSFRPGAHAKVFQGKLPIGISICSEETYSHLVREARVEGAEVFVSISNDVWFPETFLPWQHYQHGQIRAAENGVCLLRSCNMGVTGAVNCFGKGIEPFHMTDLKAGAIAFDLPIRSIPTLYRFWGDLPIISLSVLLASVLVISRFRKKKLP